ncbi:flagellar biosynthetic protein FliR, partial [Vibrio parahaemolyticus]|nr:flagellar biosynthetic protein FliR [Vibrio parahaemolyticus]
MVMTMPGIGDQSVPPRIRLSFALLMALILGPLVQNTVPPIPATLGGLVGGVIHELLIGLMIGSVLRLFMTSLTTAGEIISMQTTLSFAQSVNPSMTGASTAVASFLSMLGLTLVMATGLHHLFIGAIVKSYTIFPFT